MVSRTHNGIYQCSEPSVSKLGGANCAYLSNADDLLNDFALKTTTLIIDYQIETRGWRRRLNLLDANT